MAHSLSQIAKYFVHQPSASPSYLPIKPFQHTVRRDVFLILLREVSEMKRMIKSILQILRSLKMHPSVFIHDHINQFLFCKSSY